MVDCSSCFFTMTDERIMEFMNMYGEDRIMFGSDYPMWDAGTELARLRSLPLSKRPSKRSTKTPQIFEL